MSMQEQENFERLCRLLALKRFEQPPPGYFESFSREVITRIQAGEHLERDTLEDYFAQAPWLGRLWAVFERQPILAGAFGVLVCGLMISGILYTEQVTPGQPVVVPMPGASSSEFADSSSSASPVLAQTASRFDFSSSTGGVLNVRHSLFDEVQKPRAQRLDFPLRPSR